MEDRPMARRSKREYLQSIYARYRQSSRAEKQAILDEFMQVCGYHRKYAIWLLSRPLPSRFLKKSLQMGVYVYGPAHRQPSRRAYARTQYSPARDV